MVPRNVLITLLTVALAPAAALAGTNLVQNGDFAITTDQTTASCQLGYNCTSNGWSSPNGYNFIFEPGTATSTGAQGSYGFLSLWGAANNGMNTWDGNAPGALSGGNFLAADGAFEVQPITQAVTGLIAGDHYELTFVWAGAQQSGYTSATSEQWVVSLGNQTIQTAVVQNGAEGFTGWMTENFYYTATSSDELLSFLAVGTPGGQPPFSVLTGVSLEDVPEPTSLAVIGAGLVSVLVIRRRRAVA